MWCGERAFLKRGSWVTSTHIIIPETVLRA